MKKTVTDAQEESLRKLYWSNHMDIVSAPQNSDFEQGYEAALEYIFHLLKICRDIGDAVDSGKPPVCSTYVCGYYDNGKCLNRTDGCSVAMNCQISPADSSLCAIKAGEQN